MTPDERHHPASDHTASDRPASDHTASSQDDDIPPLPERPLRGHGRAVLALVLTAVLVRAFWALLVPVMPVSDSNAYDVFAKNIVAGAGYAWQEGNPNVYWAPGASFIYAAHYFVFGHHYAPVVVGHILAQTLTLLLAMWLAGRWYGWRAAFWTGLILALWPTHVMFTTVLASENWFPLFTLLGLFLWYAPRLPWPARALLAGLAWGAAAYLRPPALLFPVLMLMLDLRNLKGAPRLAGTAALCWVAMLALLAPWAIRNNHHFGEYVLVSANSGANLWMGNNPESTGAYMDLPEDVMHLNTVERDAELKARAVAYIKERPGRFLVMSAKRLFDTYNRETIGVAWNQKGIAHRFGDGAADTLFKLGATGYYGLALLLGLAGVAWVAWQHPLTFPFRHAAVLYWAYFAAVHAVVVSQDRYHLPSNPFIAMLAAVALGTLITRLRGRPGPQDAAGSA